MFLTIGLLDPRGGLLVRLRFRRRHRLRVLADRVRSRHPDGGPRINHRGVAGGRPASCRCGGHHRRVNPDCRRVEGRPVRHFPSVRASTVLRDLDRRVRARGRGAGRLRVRRHDDRDEPRATARGHKAALWPLRNPISASRSRNSSTSAACASSSSCAGSAGRARCSPMPGGQAA